MKITGLPPAPIRPEPASPAARAATKFEALIVGEMLKAMRTAKLNDGAFDSEGENHWTGMRDQQFAQALAERTPLGVAAHMGSAPE